MRFTIENQGVRYKNHDSDKQMVTTLGTDGKFGQG